MAPGRSQRGGARQGLPLQVLTLAGTSSATKVGLRGMEQGVPSNYISCVPQRAAGTWAALFPEPSSGPAAPCWHQPWHRDGAGGSGTGRPGTARMELPSGEEVAADSGALGVNCWSPSHPAHPGLAHTGIPTGCE